MFEYRAPKIKSKDGTEFHDMHIYPSANLRFSSSMIFIELMVTHYASHKESLTTCCCGFTF